MKKSFLSLLLLTLLLLLPIAAKAYERPSTCPQALMTEGRLQDGKDAPIYSEPDKKSEVKGRFPKGEVCEITGREGAFYRVEWEGVTGYISRGLLKTKAVSRDGELPETNLSEITMDDYLPTVVQAKEMPLHGEIRSSSDMDTLFFYLWDERLQRVEHFEILKLNQETSSVSIPDIRNSIKPSRITAGRKTLVFQSGSKDGQQVLSRTFMYVRGAFKEVPHITDQCKVSGYRVSRWGEKTAWSPTKAKPSLLITLPKDGSAALMTLDWWLPPDEIFVEYLDEEDGVLSTETLSTGFYLDSIPLNKDMKKVRITPKGSELTLKILRVYDDTYPRDVVQEWQSVPEKVDMMVFSAHQDDELLFLGGTVPYACAMGKEVCMVYMTNGGRSRYREALDGMWTAGLRNHPIFFNWRDQKVKSLKTARKTWYMNGHDPVGDLVALIRKYKPDVIVTQDLNGEYGHTQHRLTAILLTEAVKLTADASNYPESAAEYGVWDVKKMYVHLYEENQITMDWDQPLDDSGVITPMLLAREAYDKHRSQQSAYNIVKDGKKYNNRLFGLYYTTVGQDVEKNDFFENIPD